MQNNQKIFFSILGVFVLFGLYYFNPINFYFLNDDFIHISLAKNNVLFQRNSLRPIGDLSLIFDYNIGKLNATQYHFTNLVLHVINTVLVFFCSTKIIKKYFKSFPNIETSIVTSVFFFLYAFHSEAIFWILGRSASLGMLFFLLSTLCFFKKEENKFYTLLFFIFFIIGLFAYESVWFLPVFVVAIILFNYKNAKHSFKKQLAFLGFSVLIFAAYLFVRKNITNEFLGTYETHHIQEFHVFELFKNYGRLIARSFLPPFTNSLHFLIASIIVSILIVVLTCFFIVKKKFKWLMLFIIYLLSLTPYISLGIDTHGVEGERFLYMPSFFLIIFIVGSVYKFMVNKILRQLVIIVLLLFNSYYLYQSHATYRYASNYVEYSLSFLEKNEFSKTIFIDSLPIGIRGASIFRTGFEESLQLLMNEKTNVVICSIKKNQNKQSSSYTISKNEFNFSKEISEIMIPDSTFKQPYISQKINPILISKTNAVYLKFKDEGIEVYQ